MEELRQWLIDNGCYEQWCRNVQNGDDIDDTLHTLIDSAFTWAETPEGHEYWKTLHRKAPDAPRMARRRIDDVLEYFESLNTIPELKYMEGLKTWKH